ncbi:unnamed protein product [Arctia plantaginis]|uniref:PiggyBac transposable element-derived protein domain-containing protein n=1 Tax=Arctia plantaginis TaxID=874455 RepID=A0A8S1A8F7_ARCPL|nr:unnamed protein product [Arctia plantaginis]
MKRDRFRAIYSCLHLHDNSNYVPRGHENCDAFFKLRPYFDDLCRLCESYCLPIENLTIDEETCGFRGRVHFRVFNLTSLEEDEGGSDEEEVGGSGSEPEVDEITQSDRDSANEIEQPSAQPSESSNNEEDISAGQCNNYYFTRHNGSPHHQIFVVEVFCGGGFVSVHVCVEARRQDVLPTMDLGLGLGITASAKRFAGTAEKMTKKTVKCFKCKKKGHYARDDEDSWIICHISYRCDYFVDLKLLLEVHEVQQCEVRR